MIGTDGKPLTKPALLAAIAVYNSESRGSSAFSGLPRALITVLDGLAPGKTTYLKAVDGTVQVSCGKDRKIVGK